MKRVIQTYQLTKQYQHQKALNNFNFQLMQGQICAIIGKNAAGKSTFFKLLANETLATSGKIELFEQKNSDINLVHKRFGFLIEAAKFFNHMTAYQNLKYFAKLRGLADLQRIDEVLQSVGLTDARNRKVHGFSMGMKQRLGIAQALLHHPDCLVLDEPTNGLDAKGIADIRHLLLKLNKEYGITILISSHILSELKMIGERFIFIRDGQLIKDVSKKELEEQMQHFLVLKAQPVEKAVSVLEMNFNGIQYTVLPDDEIRIENNVAKLGEINSCLVQHQIQVHELRVERVDLEQYFLKLEGE